MTIQIHCCVKNAIEGRRNTYGDVGGLNDIGEGHVVQENGSPEVGDLCNDSTTLLVDGKHELVALVG